MYIYMAEILPIRRKTPFNQSICFVLFERFCRMKIIYLKELFLKDSYYLLMLKSSFPNKKMLFWPITFSVS